MTNNNVYVHIGLLKTSTTHIQRLFSLIKYDKFLYNHEIFDEMNKIINMFAHNEISFNDLKINIMKEKLNHFFLKNSDKCILYSEEGLSNSGYGMVSANNINKRMKLLNYFIPQAKIILFIREHKRWIVSQYKQSILIGNFQSFKKFINNGENEISCEDTYRNGILPKITIRNIQFKEFIEITKKYFGKKNLFVFKYEFFKKDYKKNFEKILYLIFSDNLTKIDLSSLPYNEKTYRSLSGLSITIILTLNVILRPLVKRMYYNKNFKLFNFSGTKSNDSFLSKYFNWVRVRKLFQKYIDRIYYIDLSFTKNKIKELSKYQDFFDKDNYNSIETYE